MAVLSSVSVVATRVGRVRLPPRLRPRAPPLASLTRIHRTSHPSRWRSSRLAARPRDTLADSSASPSHRRYPLPLDAARAATVVAAAPRAFRAPLGATRAQGGRRPRARRGREPRACRRRARGRRRRRRRRRRHPRRPRRRRLLRRQRLQGRRRRPAPALRLHGFQNYQKNLTIAGRPDRRKKRKPPMPKNL